MELLKVKDLGFKYAGSSGHVLDGVSFSVESGSFTVVQGATGSGKTTLLKILKKELRPAGELTGSVELMQNGASGVGFVMQRPEEQIVTDKVWHELAFGLENFGMPSDAIRRRVAEMAGYFGISSWFEKDVSELSGGQKQLLNLASVMVTDPALLLLDEPAAQLDPIAADEFMRTLERLRRDLGVTVIMTEHRLEDVVPSADNILVLEKGRVKAFGKTGDVIKARLSDPIFLGAMPASVQVYAAFGGEGRPPLTAAEGREYINERFSNDIRSLPRKEKPGRGAALEMKDVSYRYEKNGPDVIRGLDLTVREGEIFALLGDNGSGKTTALCLAAGLFKNRAGSIKLFDKKLSEYKNQSLYRGNVVLLPQDVQTVFLKNTLAEELKEAGASTELIPFDLSPLLERHPYDLSGGEMQLAALCKALAAKPRLLMLDEPTKGLDSVYKNVLADVLRDLRDKGITVLLVTHDLEFAAACADRCALLFRGEVVSCAEPEIFFPQNRFYTTAASRMSYPRYDGAVTPAALIELLKLNERRATW